MTLGQKIKYLRTVEGRLRGLGRAMTQVEVSRAMQRELRKKVSQSYLSQLENGSRPHLTSTTRALLAKFFKIHPGFLVDDPSGYDAELEADLDTTEGKLDLWLMQGARSFGHDPELAGALMRIAGQKNTRRAVILFGAILAEPKLADRLHSARKLRHAAKHDVWSTP
jgi:transcriptional regulator with XRE-family HTH domain